MTLVVFAMSAHSASAATYYVSTSGSDSNAGTSTAAPWKTISKVNSKVSTFQPGDNILFKRGDVFTGSQSGQGVLNWENKSGTAAAPITISNYGTGVLPVFELAAGSTVILENRNFMFFNNASYIIIDGFNITDRGFAAAHPNDPRKDAFAYNGVAIRMQAQNDNNRVHDNIIRNMEISYTGMGIVLESVNNTLVTGSSITDLQNFVNTQCGTNQSGSCSYEDYGANALTLINADSNTFSYNYFRGIWASSLDFGYNGGVMEMYQSNNNNNFLYSTVIDSGGVSEFGSSNGSSSNNNLYAYNLLINNGALSYLNLSGNFATAVSNVKYYNNTIVSDANDRFINVGAPDFTGAIFKDNYIFGFGGSPTGTAFDLRNNIFYITNAIKVKGSGSDNNYIHQNNIYKLVGSAKTGFGSGNTVNTSEAITTTPVFTTTPSMNSTELLLAAGSPAIDKGANLGYTVDRIGNAVPKGLAPDAGAYEYSSTGGGGDNFPPTVLFTTPVSGSTVIGIIPVTVSASDNTGVVGVQFTLDGAALGTEDTVFPYSATWNTAVSTNGAHTLTATARDAAGNTAMATSFVTVNNPPTGDGIAPTVSFSSPAAGSTVSGTTTVSASATDNVAVANVKFTLDGILHTTDTTAPYSASWISPGVPDGSHTWTVVATDTSGNVSSTATRSFTVSNTVTSNPTAPTGLTATAVSTSQVALSWNSSGAVYGYEIYRNGVDIGHTTGSGTTYTDTGLSANTTYTYNVSAIYPCDCNETPQSNTATVTTTITTANPTVPTGLTGTNVGTQVSVTWVPSTGTVTGYRVYRNGVLVGQVATTSFSETVAASGTYTYTVAAYNAGFESAQSVPLVISIGSSAPVVSMTSPVSGSTISGIIAVSANATDANGIASVTFKVDGSQIGSVDTIAPYTVSLDTATILNGSHVISATAVDTTGLSTTANATVTVTNTAAASYKLTARVNVRLNPTTGSTGTVLGQQNKGAIGTVVGGPVSKNGYIWYKLDFPTGVDGWVVSKYMTVYSTARTANPPLVGTTESTTTVVLDDTQSRAMTLLQQAASAPTTAEANRLIAEARLLISR